jgi:hypothetical protein
LLSELIFKNSLRYSLTLFPQDVTRLAAAMDFTGDVGYTCETAQHFYELSLVPRWSDYRKRVAEEKNSTFLQLHFPFAKFFADAPQPLFLGTNFEVRAQTAFSLTDSFSSANYVLSGRPGCCRWLLASRRESLCEARRLPRL